MRFFSRINWGRATVIGIPYFWLIIFFLLPFLIIFKISVSEMQEGASPFADLLNWTDGILVLRIKLSNYLFLAQDDLYVKTLLNSLKFASITTFFCLVIGYPFAYCMSRAPAAWRSVLVMLVILPFWTSFLIRIYAWKGILASNGILNNVLSVFGIEPLQILNTPLSLCLGMVYAYLPFMVLPLYSNLVKQDIRYIEAALDLGATPWMAFWKVTVPLSLSGITAGSLLVFIPAVGEYVIPELLGGPRTVMIGRVLWDEMFSNLDWPMSATVAVVLILVVLLPFVWLTREENKSSGGVLA
jgi:putrescine transport system permease protein